MKHKLIHNKDFVATVNAKFDSRRGYVTKITAPDAPNTVIGFIARCESPTPLRDNLVTIYLQWVEHNMSIADAKVIAKNRAMTVAERWEKSVNSLNVGNTELTTFEEVLPPQGLVRECFVNDLTDIGRSYFDLRMYVQKMEDKTKSYYKDKNKQIIWGSSSDLKKRNMNYGL